MGGVPVVIETSGGLDMNAALNTIAVVSKNYPQLQFIQPRISGKSLLANLNVIYRRRRVQLKPGGG
jgi:hypothetical protein